jgi:hypothetical protein
LLEESQLLDEFLRNTIIFKGTQFYPVRNYDSYENILWQQYMTEAKNRNVEYYSFESFRQKLKGWCKKAMFRDGLCSTCKNGQRIMLKKANKKPLNETEKMSDAALQVHIVCIIHFLLLFFYSFSFFLSFFLFFGQREAREWKEYYEFLCETLDESGFFFSLVYFFFFFRTLFFYWVLFKQEW